LIDGCLDISCVQSCHAHWSPEQSRLCSWSRL